MRIFIDTDVVISSLLSKKGAANYLLHESKPRKFISNISLVEIQKVAKRLNIDRVEVDNLVESKLQVVEIKSELAFIKSKYGEFVADVDDTHIVAGANSSKSRYLISYNLRHFKIDKIKDQYGIILLTPALFLQYLRSA